MGHVEQELKPRRRWLAPAFLGWTVLVVVALWLLLRNDHPSGAAPQIIVHGGEGVKMTAGERARDWLTLVHLNFARIYPWIFFTPYVLWLASRFHLERERLAINLPVLAGGCAVFALATHLINAKVSVSRARVVVVTSNQKVWNGPSGEAKMMRMEVTGGSGGAFVTGEEFGSAHHWVGTAGPGTNMEFTNWIPTNLLPKLETAMKPPLGPPIFSPLAALLDVLAYGSLAGLAHAVHFYRRYRERERRALFLESNLTKARLSALQAQLQPHFLFNTLNAIATLLRRDAKAAEATLLSLSELLRLSLSQSDTQEIPLREELRFLDRYLEIQQTRFGDRLRFEQEIEPRALDCLVPALILQPLVENAIRHGFEPSGAPGLIRVTARELPRADAPIPPQGNGEPEMASRALELKVEDNGVGLTNAGPAAKGIGLPNLRIRLETLYRAGQRIEILSRSEGGVIIRIEIPWRSSENTAASAADSKPD